MARGAGARLRAGESSTSVLTGGRGPAGAAGWSPMTAELGLRPEPVRVVVLLGAEGAGKSSLAAALLAAAGAPPAEVPGPGRLAHGALEHRGVRVVLLDPPGADLVGEVHAGLRAAGAALFVVSPAQGLDARTAQLWSVCEAAGLPRLVVLTQLDRPGADADEAVAVCQRLLGEGALPLQLPLHDDDGQVAGLLDLLGLRVSDATGPAARPADPEHVRLVEGLREELLEAVLTGSEDEELFERWLAGAEPPTPVLSRELAAAVARGDLQPVLVAAPRGSVGVAELLDLLVTALPDATARPAPPVLHPDGSPAGPLTPDPAGPLVAEAVRTGLLRVWSGSLRPVAPVLVDRRDPGHHAGPVPYGAPSTHNTPRTDEAPVPYDAPVPYAGPPAGPGDVVATGLDVLPGDVVCEPQQPLVLAGWAAPLPAFPVGVPADPGLVRRVAEDPVARLQLHADTGQLLLWSTGPRHAELLLDGLPSAPVVVPPGDRLVAVRLQVPAWCAGSVRSDLAGRGGEVVDSGQDEQGTWIEARLPEAEVGGYAPALAALTGGTGSLTWGR